MCASLSGSNYVHDAPFCVYDMSTCSSRSDLHDGVVCIHVVVYIDSLIFVAKLLCDMICRNLLIVNIISASCECHNFVPVDDMMMIFICTCSALRALHVGVLCFHVRVHLDILIPVAKCMLLLTTENCCNLLICHFCCILCVHPMGMMSTCFRSIFMQYLHECNLCSECIKLVKWATSC